MLTPKLSEVIFFFLVLSATPGPAEPRGPRGPMGPRGTRGPLAPPILGPDEGKIFFLKCSTMYFFLFEKVEFTHCHTKSLLLPSFFWQLK